ncbi:phenylacetate--CoA ligase family protein [Sporosarcina sp. BI001-red]|uniref:phenylacetate--CoA ligase family protein n=1 Tax=Sporosarcina sp. BI001-red TaxID=2282866 RepID=UPI000E2718FC|nr:AMP-binding protein [Sporosarcina sp. BI001-red]REB08762.1 phenylacetate--CoA ligase family protein [Sporosarcina sp. BI001-red]
MRAVRYVTEALNHLSDEEIHQIRETKLINQLKYCYRNSEFYQKKFKEVGIVPQDIRSIEDYLKLPVLMDKDQERLSQQESMERFGHPFGMHLCASPDDIALTATTSGTTGIPTFTYTLAQQDLDKVSDGVASMLNYARISQGDRMLFSHALGVYATSAVLPGIRQAGILPIDVDVRAGTEAILQYAKMTNPQAAMMTPSLAEHLIGKSLELHQQPVGDLNLSALFTVGEIAISIPEVKQKIEEAYGCRVYDWIGPIGGTIAYSCDSDDYHGMHCVTPDYDLYPYDLVDPATQQPIDIVNGAIGEVIYTSLDRLAAPMLRMASGDIVQVFTTPCPGCGFKGMRVKVVGRSDDMLIVKGVNVYPAAIKQVITTYAPDVTGEMRIVLDQEPPLVKPPLKVKLEFGPDMDRNALPQLEARIKEQLSRNVRVNPEIIWCPPGTLEKSMAKTPVFEKDY